ncbi:hypothetical protein HWV62_18028 [Athelia sp. TMB]|nr:hypothetical protein HWV62_18028 [Athelia sp. TMB]
MTRRIWGWIALTVPVANFLLRASGSSEQIPLLLDGLANTEIEADNSNFILAALHSNLKAWPQAYAPNGRAIVPATIRAGTLLYHAGLDPIGMGWLAIDAEHSYGYGGGGGQAVAQGAPYSMLYTYAAARSLRTVYFDGFSAAKQFGGAQDLQDMVVGLDSKAQEKIRGNLDYERGRLLCEWGKQYGIQGFVREEATFELLWCDFEDGIELLSATNITIPADLKSEYKLGEEPPRGPGFGPPGRGGMSTPYRAAWYWWWYKATAWHHTAPDTRVVLHPAYTVTLYDPKYKSLAENSKLPRRQHRLVDLSADDKTVFRTELDTAMKAWTNNDPRGEGSGVDWSSIAHGIVERNGDRIAELHILLSKVNATSNITELVSTARLIAFGLILPYVDHATIFAPYISAPKRRAVLSEASTQCSLAFTGHIDAPRYHLTPQEQRLKQAAEGVLGRICGFATQIFNESLTLLDMLANEADLDLSQAQTSQALASWRGGVERLMDWLGWAMWQRCPDICAWDEVCYLPMWPINIHQRNRIPGGGKRGSADPLEGPPPGRMPPPMPDNPPPIPRCAKREEF